MVVLSQWTKAVILWLALLPLLRPAWTVDSISSQANANSGRFQLRLKACAPGCEKHGNCNGETGECDCMFGFGGMDCSHRLMPACHHSKAEGSLPMFGATYPKNCLCWKQLQKLVCFPPYAADSTSCFHDGFSGWASNHCFRYKGVTDADQLSDPPNGTNDPRVEWYQHVLNYTKDVQDHDPFVFAPSAPPKDRAVVDTGTWEPMSKCPDRCSERGWCSHRPYIDGWNISRSNTTACMCRGFILGERCEQLNQAYCFRNCSGRGACVAGWCHCEPGYWGIGCVRSKAYDSPQGWLPDHARLRIYIYHLPEHVAHRKPYNDYPPTVDFNYLAESQLLEALLGDARHVTENPWEANLFFVPAFGVYYYGNIGEPGWHLQRVFDYVRGAAPFWNLTLGRNHVVVATNDRGSCDDYKFRQEVLQPIKLVHFGQAPRLHLEHTYHTYRKAGRGAPAFDPLDEASHNEWAKLVAAGGRGRFPGFPDFQEDAVRAELDPCYRPERDVVIAGYLHPSFCETCPEAAFHINRATGEVRHARNTRPMLFYHYGYSKWQMDYSQGVRQAIIALFKNTNRADVSINKLVTGTVMLGARFCLAPMGFGWGIRLYKAMRAGCIPVIIEDGVYPPFWDLLPYQDFSVRVGRQDVSKLLDILDSIGPSEVARLQDGVAKHWRAFEWAPELGGKAYNYTILSLARRLTHLWANHFHRRARRLLLGPE